MEDIEFEKASVLSVSNHNSSCNLVSSASFPSNGNGNAAIPIAYDASHLSSEWLYVAIVCHIVQFSYLMDVDDHVLSPATFGFLLILVVAVPLLLLTARCLVVKKKNRNAVRCVYKSPDSPEDETDLIPDRAILIIALASVLEGLTLATYAVRYIVY